MKSYEQILREVGDACDYVRTSEIISDPVADGVLSGGELTHLSDTDLVLNYIPILPELEPSEIAVNTASEVALVYEALGRIHRMPTSYKNAYYTISHEGAHLTAAGSLFEQVEYRIKVTGSKPEGFYRGCSTQPYSTFALQKGDLPKIAIASVIAAPFDLSEGDLARLTAMGYAGREDVAHRIKAATDPLISSLALPEIFPLNL